MATDRIPSPGEIGNAIAVLRRARQSIEESDAWLAGDEDYVSDVLSSSPNSCDHIQMIEDFAAMAVRCEDMKKMLEEVIERYKDRAKRFGDRSRKIRETIAYVMDSLGMKKLQAYRFSMSLRKGVETIEIFDESAIPDHFFEIITERTVDRSLLKAHLLTMKKEEREALGARIVTGKSTVSIYK